MQVRSPDSQMADGQGHIQNQTVNFLDGEKILNILLAVSVLVNIWAIFALRDVAMQKELARYEDLHAVTDLQKRVEIVEKLIPVQCARGVER